MPEATERLENIGELVNQAKSGSAHAWSTLFRQHWGLVYGICVRSGAGDESEDLAQETFIQARERLTQLTDNQAFPSWIFKIAYRVVLERHRTRTRQRLLREAAYCRDEMPFSSKIDPPHVATDRNIERQIVVKCLSELPYDMRVAIELKYYVGLSYDAIAKTLNSKVSTVKGYVARGMSRMRRCFERNKLSARSER